MASTTINRAIASFGRTFGHPHNAVPELSLWEMRQARLILLWGYYSGTAFDMLQDWARYKADYGLVYDIRLLRSHVKKLVDFYNFHVYSGELSEDGLNLPNGVPNAIPLAPDTDKDLAQAIATLWKWWGWVDGMLRVTKWAPATGNCFVELVDDIMRQKVYADVVWPGYVKEVAHDRSGNVIRFVKEYQAWDAAANDGQGSTFTYRREVDKTSIREFYNDEPHNFDGMGAVRANKYGFVPVVQYQHEDIGTSWGEPALYGTQVQLDELNSLMTGLVDYQRVILDAPIMVSGTMAPGTIKNQMEAYWEAQAATPMEGQPIPATIFKVLQVSTDAQIKAVTFDSTHIAATVKDIREGIEDTVPEVKFWDQIRSMSTVTKPGVSMALGDVFTRLRTYSSKYDRQSKKLFQMGVAIAGQNLKDGTWQRWATATGRSLTDEHRLFEGFDLESYDDGKLDLTIMPRELIPTTRPDALAMALQEDGLGLPRDYIYENTLGITRAQIDTWLAEGKIAPMDTVDTVTAGARLGDLVTQPVPVPETPEVPAV